MLCKLKGTGHCTSLKTHDQHLEACCRGIATNTSMVLNCVLVIYIMMKADVGLQDAGYHHTQDMKLLILHMDIQMVKLEHKSHQTTPGRSRYMVLVSTQGRQDMEECIIMGIDIHHPNARPQIASPVLSTAAATTGEETSVLSDSPTSGTLLT